MSSQHRIATASDHRIASDASVKRQSSKDSLPEFSIEFDANESQALGTMISCSHSDYVTALPADFSPSMSSSFNSANTQKTRHNKSSCHSSSSVVETGSCVMIGSSLNCQTEQGVDRNKTTTSSNFVTTGSSVKSSLNSTMQKTEQCVGNINKIISTSRSVDITTGLRSDSGLCEDMSTSSGITITGLKSISNSCSVSSLEPVLGKERMHRLMENLRHIDLVSTPEQQHNNQHHYHHHQQQHCECSVAIAAETEFASHRTRRTCDVWKIRTFTREEDRRRTSVPEVPRDAGTCDAEEDLKVVEDNDAKMSLPLAPVVLDDWNHNVNSTSHSLHHNVVSTTTSEPCDVDDVDDADSYGAALKRSFRARVDSVKCSLLQQSDLLFTRSLTSSRDLEPSSEGHDRLVNVRDSENFVYEESQEGQKRAAQASFPDALRQELVMDLDLVASVDPTEHLAMTSHRPRDRSHMTTSDSFRFDYVDLCVEETPLPPALRQQLRLDLRGSLNEENCGDCHQQPPAGSTDCCRHQQTDAR